MRITFFLLLFMLGVVLSMEARHIIGGEMSYECLGEELYRFRMLVYRDCQCTQCADFDQSARFAAYICETEDCANPRLFQTRSVSLKNRQEVQPPDLPCLNTPSNVCVEEGFYEFDMNLPVITGSYHLVYQRCCRNITISNITRPGDIGASYTVEISSLAQQSCNNSPVFDNFPPTIVCANEPLVFDHAATDAEGDQLVYEFCAPLQGGGVDGGPQNPGGNPGGCTGVAPNPPCQPPFTAVPYITPTYTPREPMAGDPIVQINPNTGMITGTPRTLGQFVVGVCVSEYRNGRLLSRIRRDFQFNVTRCSPRVTAAIASDSIANEQEYVLNICGENTVHFENRSTERQNITGTSWQFDIAGETQLFNDWSPTVTFPDTGQYRGILILNEGEECTDTASILLNVFPEIVADFEFEYDTCVAGPVQFTDLSYTGAGAITAWRWEFGDGNESAQQHPLHTYMIPGDLPVSLLVADKNRCKAKLTKPISYFPVPNLIVIAPSAFEGCAPADIFFSNLSFPIDSTYDIHWDFGDGESGFDISPTHLYQETGIFTVNVEITSPIGCTTSETFPRLIRMIPAPIADFSFTPTELSSLNSAVTTTDLSTDAVQWRWNFSNLGHVFSQDATFMFPDTGQHFIQLVVAHPSGCLDSLTKHLEVVPEVRYFLPNAFTPNNDGTNDFFRGGGIFDGIREFEFTIWNRWGELIFNTDDPNEAWNGQKQNNGQASPEGVYVCNVHFRGPRGKPFDYQSFVTLVR